MNEYEKYLQEKLDIAEKKIESLYYQMSLEIQINAMESIKYRKQLNKLRVMLSVAYDIAYDLMPDGPCPTKIMDYSKELRDIATLLNVTNTE